MHIKDYRTLYAKYLDQLHNEILAIQSDEQLWALAPGVLNSCGNLGLHLAGNLRTFVGDVIGHSGYVRDRDAEFQTKGLSREQVAALIATAKQEVEAALMTLNDSDLVKPYPIDKFGADRSNGYVLLYLLGHLNYHLGQVNYLRRILSK